MIESKTTGLDELMAHIDALTKAPRIKAGCSAEGYHADGRANAMIFRSQAKKGRSPSFLNDLEDAGGMQIVVEMANGWTDRLVDVVYAKARELGALITEAVRKHIEAGQSVDGAMAPLSERYKYIKKHVWHADNKPILVRTGELLASLVPHIVIRGGGR